MSASCFGVINKYNNKVYDIFDVTYDKAGYPHFLIYKDNQWARVSAKHFRPLEDKDLFASFLRGK